MIRQKLRHIVKPTVFKGSNIISMRLAIVAGMISTVTFVCINAAFLQSGGHPSALFNMREKTPQYISDRSLSAKEQPTNNVTRIVFGQEYQQPARNQQTKPLQDKILITKPSISQRPQTIPQNPSQEILAELQTALKALGYYAGEIDGLNGIQTQDAINSFKIASNLTETSMTYMQLLKSAQKSLVVTSAINERAPLYQSSVSQPLPPLPKTRPQNSTALPKINTQEQPQINVAHLLPPQYSKETVLKVQAGLKSFRNDISIDGVFGDKTAEAISEFQALFSLPVTGKIDDDLLRRMEEFGLIKR